jgi:hypothetical protein
MLHEVLGAPLGLRAAHRVRGRALLSEVHHGVGLHVFEELHELRVLLRDVDVVEGDHLPADLLPRL